MENEPTVNETPDEEMLAQHPLTRLIHEEDGAVIMEYVILLINVFLWLSLTVQPLQNALMWFAEQVYDHLHAA